MKKYIINVNLPFGYEIWNKDEFIHQILIYDSVSDSYIWNYAKDNNLIILSRDSDFAFRFLDSVPPPKVIQFRVGNLKKKELEFLITKYWNEIITKIKYHKLVIVYKDRIESII